MLTWLHLRLPWAARRAGTHLEEMWHLHLQRKGLLLAGIISRWRFPPQRKMPAVFAGCPSEVKISAQPLTLLLQQILKPYNGEETIAFSYLCFASLLCTIREFSVILLNNVSIKTYSWHFLQILPGLTQYGSCFMQWNLWHGGVFFLEDLKLVRQQNILKLFLMMRLLMFLSWIFCQILYLELFGLKSPSLSQWDNFVRNLMFTIWVLSLGFSLWVRDLLLISKWSL